ncbi:PAS domain S-box protein [bacterium]|nr:PAS domain S-box protein [bacterium]
MTIPDAQDHNLAVPAALRLLPEKLEEFIHFLPDALVEIDLSTQKLTYANRMAYILFGYDEAEPLAEIRPEDVFAPGEFERAAALIAAYRTQGWDPHRGYTRTGRQDLLDFEMRKRDGAPFHAEVQASFVLSESKVPVRLRLLFRDVSERRRAEQALRTAHEDLEQRVLERTAELSRVNAALQAEIDLHRQTAAELSESEHRFRQMAENIEAVFYLTSLDHAEMIYLSPAFEKIWGRTVASLLDSPQQWLAALLPEDQRRLQALIASQPGGAVYDEIYRIVRPDGTIHWIRDRCFPIHQPQGRIFRIAGIAEDITPFKEAEERLRQSEERYRALFEDNPSMYFTVDAAGSVLSVNHFGAEQLGYTVEELLGQPVFLVFRPEDRAAVEAQLQTCLAQPGQVFQWEMRKIRKSGTLLWVKELGRAVQHADGQPVVLIVCEDITAHKQAETVMRESEKFLATGRMAARIAHEINNPLAAIKTALRLVGGAVPPEHRHFHYVAKADKEIDRIADIVRQMLALYRPGQEARTEFDCNHTLQEVVALMRLLSKQRRVDIALETQCEAGTLRLPENHIRQIMYNLLQNAVEASPPGETVQVRAKLHAGRLVITVSDRGSGITATVAEQVFEPFFTTKGDSSSSGMGLGLSICKSLVDSLQGSITFNSTPGQGAVFTVELPVPVRGATENSHE